MTWVTWRSKIFFAEKTTHYLRFFLSVPPTHSNGLNLAGGPSSPHPRHPSAHADPKCSTSPPVYRSSARGGPSTNASKTRRKRKVWSRVNPRPTLLEWRVINFCVKISLFYFLDVKVTLQGYLSSNPTSIRLPWIHVFKTNQVTIPAPKHTRSNPNLCQRRFVGIDVVIVLIVMQLAWIPLSV